ncbi:hypothetical protein FJTKL_15380 [Diaporthe vaccinii]|uniref:Uncharacterized protein n=1 Tax=Diaporthe vaccinii TaxID=105482 RepID=A0ABR4E560_9PEZI
MTPTQGKAAHSSSMSRMAIAPTETTTLAEQMVLPSYYAFENSVVAVDQLNEALHASDVVVLQQLPKLLVRATPLRLSSAAICAEAASPFSALRARRSGGEETKTNAFESEQTALVLDLLHPRSRFRIESLLVPRDCQSQYRRTLLAQYRQILVQIGEAPVQAEWAPGSRITRTDFGFLLVVGSQMQARTEDSSTGKSNTDSGLAAAIFCNWAPSIRPLAVVKWLPPVPKEGLPRQPSRVKRRAKTHVWEFQISRTASPASRSADRRHTYCLEKLSVHVAPVVVHQ